MKNDAQNVCAHLETIRKSENGLLRYKDINRMVAEVSEVDVTLSKIFNELTKLEESTKVAQINAIK